MKEQAPNRSNYDIVSISRKGSDKKTNYVQNALNTAKVEKTSGQFVRVFADIFLKAEAGRKAYF